MMKICLFVRLAFIKILSKSVYIIHCHPVYFPVKQSMAYNSEGIPHNFIPGTIYWVQGYKENYSICGAYLSLAYAGQRKPVFLY